MLGLPLTLLCLVSLVVGWTKPPGTTPRHVAIAKLCAVRVAKNILVLDHSVDIPQLLSRELRGRANHCWSCRWIGATRRADWGRRSLRRFGHVPPANKSNGFGIRRKNKPAGRRIRWIDNRVFGWRIFQQLNLHQYRAIFARRSPAIPKCNRKLVQGCIIGISYH